ncbi:MAG: leucine-rich repeat protein [Eubacterium sp.]|nr:leucine-rich repeat protein [Eubacterium sp.]
MRKLKSKVFIILAVCMTFLIGLSGGTLIYGGMTGKVYAANIKSVKINKTNFPDDNFRKIISGPSYDRDGNGTLDKEEIGLTINIYCEGAGIKSLKGVEYFVDLQGLWCKDNELKTLDITALKDLRGLWCSGNKLTKLDMSQNSELVWVYCYDCKLTALDVSHNPKMAFIECNTNPITKLDVSKNPELEHLTCGTCQIKKLDLSNNPKLAHLDAFRNKLKELDVTHNPKMKRLDIWDNPGLGSIDVSKNPGLQYYNCAHNGVTSIDVSNNPYLQKLICSYNNIKSLDVSNNPKLVYLDCAVNNISKLDLSNNPQLFFLQAFTNSFKKLNIGDNPCLVKTYKEGKKKNESAVCKGHSWTINYGGELLYFLCFDDAVKLSTKATKKTSENETYQYSDLEEGLSEDDLLTREMVVELLYELAGKPSVSGLKTRFKDVKKGAWYEKAILWGEKKHICIGFPDVESDKFGVGKWITRQDLAFMLYRYADCMKYNSAFDFGRSDDYIDYYDIDFYAWEAVTWVATWDIISGKGAPGAPKEEQRIDPHGRVTRDVLQRAINRLHELNYEKKVKIPEYYSNSDGAYKVTSSSDPSVTFLSFTGTKVTDVTVPDVVTIKGKEYKVTEIAPGAFKNNKKLRKITIGKNIKKIGKNAFYGCKNLKTVIIRTTKLKKKTVGKNAFKKINSRAKVTVPKKKYKAYKKLLKARGIKGKKQKIKK